MHANVNLEHIVLVQRHLIPRVWRVVRRAVIPAQPRREPHPSLDAIALLQPHVSRQVAHRILDPLGNLRQRRAGLDELLPRPGAHLAVHDGALAVLADEIVVEPVEVALLLARRAVRVLVHIGDLFPGRVCAVGVQLGDGDAGRGRLLGRGGGGLLLLLLAGLPLLLCCSAGGAIVLLVVVVLVGVVVRGSGGPVGGFRRGTCRFDLLALAVGMVGDARVAASESTTALMAQFEQAILDGTVWDGIALLMEGFDVRLGFSLRVAPQS